jgi:hypothetical protein
MLSLAGPDDFQIIYLKVLFSSPRRSEVAPVGRIRGQASLGGRFARSRSFAVSAFRKLLQDFPLRSFTLIKPSQYQIV